MRRDCAHWGRSAPALAPAPAGRRVARESGRLAVGPRPNDRAAAAPARPGHGTTAGWGTAEIAGTGTGRSEAYVGSRWHRDGTASVVAGPGCGRRHPGSGRRRGSKPPIPGRRRRGIQARRRSSTTGDRCPGRSSGPPAPLDRRGGGGAPAPACRVVKAPPVVAGTRSRTRTRPASATPSPSLRCGVVPPPSRVIGHQPVSSTASTGATEATA